MVLLIMDLTFNKMRLKMNKVFSLIACFSVVALAQQVQHQLPVQQPVAQPALSPVEQGLNNTSLPASCKGDFASVMGQSNFDMTKFTKDLSADVPKVKAKLKSPVGKPKDSDKTSSGVTVGCVKALPESPAAITSLLGDVSLKVGESVAAAELQQQQQALPPPPSPQLAPAPEPPPPAPVVAAPAEEVKPERRKGAQLGVRGQLVINDFSTGISKADDDIETGMGFGVGGVARFQIAETYYLSTGVDVLYRTLFNEDKGDDSMSEFALSFPIMFQIVPTPKIPLYLGAGIQVDLPFGTEDEDGDEYDERSVLDFGILIGAGYYIMPNLSIDVKAVFGLTTPSTDTDLEDGSLSQYGIGVSYFF